MKVAQQDETFYNDAILRNQQQKLKVEEKVMFDELGYDEDQIAEYKLKEKARFRPTNKKYDPSSKNTDPRNSITTYDRAMSLASQNAYEGHNQRVGDRLEKEYSDGSKVITDYEVVQATRSITVYRDPVNNKVLIAVKGTTPALNSDMTDANLKIAMASNNFDESKIVKQAQAALDQYAEKYPDAEIEMTGHSLGGTVVQHVAMKNPDKVTYATAFNPGSNPILHREEDELVGQHTNIRTVIQKGSFISNGQLAVADVVLPDPLDAASNRRERREAIKHSILTKHGQGNFLCPECENKWKDLDFPTSNDETHALTHDQRAQYDELVAEKERTKSLFGCAVRASVSCFQERAIAKENYNNFMENIEADEEYQRRKLDMSPAQFNEYKSLEAQLENLRGLRNRNEKRRVLRQMRDLRNNANQFQFKRVMSSIVNMSRKKKPVALLKRIGISPSPPVITKKMMFADTLENLVASSKTANDMVQEAKIMQQLLAATDVDVVLVDNMVEDAMKTAASTKYMKDPQNIEGYNVCPVVLQYNNYKKSINDLLKQLESSSTVDPNSNRYKGPTSYRSGTCGVPKFLNFNGVNRIDYYPPKFCVPDVTEDGAPIIVENIYSSKQNVAAPTFNVEFDTENHRLSSILDCTSENCNIFKTSCNDGSFNYLVKQNGRNLYTIEISGLTYVITPLCAFDERKQGSKFRSLFYDSKLAANGS